MILKLFEYFATFPAREGVLSAFANGKSELPHYGSLLDRIKALPEAGKMPGIKNYVFGADMDSVKRRVDAVTGTYLFIDFGEIESERDSRNSITDSLRMADTVAAKASDVMDTVERAVISDVTLALASELRARIYADSAGDASPWLHELSHKHTLIPFLMPEFQSVGWSLLFTSRGADILRLKPQIKSFMQ